MTPFTGCLHCDSIRFLAGPRGGASQNIICEACSAGYNVVFAFVAGHPWASLLINELSPPTGKPADRTGASYIIELIPHG